MLGLLCIKSFSLRIYAAVDYTDMMFVENLNLFELSFICFYVVWSAFTMAAKRFVYCYNCFLEYLT